MNQIEEFRIAMLDAGIIHNGEIFADGKLHRFWVEGDASRSENGWYILHADEILAGAFGCWKRGISQKWCAKHESTFSPEERDAWKRRMAEEKQKRLDNLSRLHAKCRLKSEKLWNKARPADEENPYMKSKGILAYGVRSISNSLLVPVRDTKGVLHGLQFIPPPGQKKRFIKNTAKAGHFHGFGKVKELTILICEGYATGASVHQCTGHAVAVAFDSGNLKPVAVELRKKYPEYRLVICADNDMDKDDNPGITKAVDAAKAVNGYLAVPEFNNGEPVSSVLSVLNLDDAKVETCPEPAVFANDMGGENA